MTRGPIDFDRLERAGVPFFGFQAGDPVFLKNEVGGTMYLVRSGLIDILMKGRVLETVGRNGIFGEMSLIEQAPRSAAALAVSNAEVAALDRPAFLALVREAPDFSLYVLQIMAQRLRRLDDWIKAGALDDGGEG